MLLIAVVVYLLITIGIGAFASRYVKTADDFMLAGRQLPLYMATTTVFATWFGSETVLGASSEFIEKGLIGVIEDPFGSSLCLILVGLFFARAFYRMNLHTLADYFGRRFGKSSELAASICLIFSYFGWTAAQLAALGIIFETVTGGAVSLETGIWIGAGIVLFYTYIGGMWAISITDFFQTIVIVVGMSVMAFLLVQKAGGFQNILNATPEGFFRMYPKCDAHSIMEYIAAWLIMSLGSIPQQDVFQRVMSSKNEDVAVQASIIGGLMYLSVAFLPLLVALCAKVLYPELLTKGSSDFLPRVMLVASPIYLQIIFFGALLSAILSTASGATLAPATIMAENLIKPHVKPMSDKSMLLCARLSVLLVVLISTVFALQGQNIYELVSSSSQLSLVSLFAPLVAGMVWKRANSQGSIGSMAVGMTLWLLFEHYKWAEIPSILPGLAGSLLAVWIISLCTSPRTAAL
ncbi:MAG: sodium:solute symporter [Cytophagales bacterium]|nr:MAG: sodium:solute symporter [Cytophagales bacterium]TAF62066.1 MAG: sodium:solute symporter [Cytophagales bacterium]